RANEFLVGQGLNLGKILGEAAEKNMGKGGGHDIAAGGQVPYEKKKEFIDLLDKLVRDSLRRKKLGS
ncbi:MAG: DHH family phosphoesterase, partial [Aigarchaeota archaeon]|nr:DHH family phosphoesterase [Aigarchaeota archaeon]